MTTLPTRRGVLLGITAYMLPTIAHASMCGDNAGCLANQKAGEERLRALIQKSEVPRPAPQRAQPEPKRPAAPAVRTTRAGRRLNMYDTHSSRKIDVVYYADGVYFADALREIKSFMRDRKNGRTRAMDVRVLDIASLAYERTDSSEPYQLVSGYRSPQLNAELRESSTGVARNSLHMLGQALDLRIGNRTVNQLARAATSCRGGGVGRYQGSNFVHMDCGDIRSWRG